jgi:hypothetical protein
MRGANVIIPEFCIFGIISNVSTDQGTQLQFVPEHYSLPRMLAFVGSTINATASRRFLMEGDMGGIRMAPNSIRVTVRLGLDLLPD